MLIHLFRFLQGYLKIRITGYSPERFLNLCKHKKIHIWGLESRKDSYEMYMKVSGFRKLKPIIKKTQTKVSILERYGLPFFFYQYRSRKLFFASFVAAGILVCFLSLFIWSIDILGNSTITDDVLFDFLESKEIRHGMLKQKVDCEEIVKALRKNFDDIVWVSVSMDGTALIIEVKENTDTFQVRESDEEPTDIYAAKEGKIVKCITRNGVPLAAVGDTVEAGDLLISGTIDVMNDSGEVETKKFVHSDADIYAETTYHYEDEIETVYEEKEYTDKKASFLQLRVGKQVVCLGYYKEKDNMREQYTREHQLKVKENFYLPIWLGIKEIKEYVLLEKSYTEEQRTEILKKRFALFCSKLEEENVVILEKDLQIVHSNQKSTASCVLKLQEPIGESRKIIDFSTEPMVEYNGL